MTERRGSVKAVVFDFDGVLADSEPLHLRTYQQILAPRGVTITREQYYAELLGFDDAGVFRAIAAQHGWSLDDGQIAALIEEKARLFEALVRTTGVLYPGAAECVERMAAACPIGIASGAIRADILAILEPTGLARHFRFIVAAEDTPRSKPAPDPYLLAAELHGVSPAECVAIEDSRWGLESARAAGLRCVGITHTYPADDLPGADVIIASLGDFTPELVFRLKA